MDPVVLEAVEMHVLSLREQKKTHPKNTGLQTDLQLYQNKEMEAN